MAYPAPAHTSFRRQDMSTPFFRRISPTAVMRWSFLAGVVLLAAVVLRQDIARNPVAAGWMVDPELRRAAERAGLCSGSNLTGVGLRGEYYAQAQWQGQPMLVRTDPLVDFDAGFDIPASEQAPLPPKSVRWTGWVKPPVTGGYRFHLGVQGATVTVAHQVFEGRDSGDAVPVELNAGRYAPVRIEIRAVPTDGAERIRLEWTTPYGARFVIPQALLFLPSESVAASAP